MARGKPGRATPGSRGRARSADVLERIGPAVTEAIEVWTRQIPGSRQPRFGLDDLAAAAMRIADQEGIAALSMRRLAGELGAGTMTLYHYVRTKGELLALVTDSVMGELILPAEELATDWRSAMTALARRSKQALERHPWMFDIVEDPGLGPNGVRHFDQSIGAAAGLPGSLTDRLDLISTVDEFVFGYCMHNRQDKAHVEDGSHDEMITYMLHLIASGDYPHLAALLDADGLDRAWQQVSDHHRDPDRFERSLGRLLDGIEAGLRR
ncbi:MAG: TetR/AcrR family transcriptional regulator [Acidimicrobiales bacterium]|nr:TetR/AcrR family transcriptional regulator [Acidimicrobiales bacterium]